MTKILLVRTTSMGDLVHTLPAVTDLARHFPWWQLDWLAEDSFADIAALHPFVRHVPTCAIRRWRKRPNWATWQAIRRLRTSLRDEHYDVVIDAQGLLKSAWLGRLAAAEVLIGFDRHSIREPLAACWYDKRYAVSRTWNAIARNRALFAQAFGYAYERLSPPDFGLSRSLPKIAGLEYTPYWVALTATSRPEKEWPESHWVALIREVAPHLGNCVLPWGSERERERAERVVAQVPNAQLAPRLTLSDAAALLAHARAVVGVDTGLVHLANALNRPLVALYTDTDPALTGVVESEHAVNLGGIRYCPNVADVLCALERVKSA